MIRRPEQLAAVVDPSAHWQDHRTARARVSSPRRLLGAGLAGPSTHATISLHGVGAASEGAPSAADRNGDGDLIAVRDLATLPDVRSCDHLEVVAH